MAEDPVEQFAFGIGLDSQAIAFMYDLPSEVQSSIIDNFDSSGSKDGNVLGRLQGYARHLLRRNGTPPPESLGGPPVKERAADYGQSKISAAPAYDPLAPLWDFSQRIGLTPSAEAFLSRLPQEVLNSVISGFDPSGTKDGNVWGRLLGYVRSHWSRFLHLDQECSSYIRGLPEEIQLLVMTEFDPRGSKDGNVVARLTSFVKHVELRGVAPGRSAVAEQYHPQTVPARNHAPVAPASAHKAIQRQHQFPVGAPVGAPPVGAAVSEGKAILDFSQRMRLDRQATAFLQSLPQEVVSVVIAKFDPSGTKDGNVWGRLLGYIRHLWCRHTGADQATIDHLRSLSENEQMQAMADPSRKHGDQATRRTAAVVTPPRARYGGPVAAVRQFAARWSLNSDAEAFIGALPQSVRDTILSGFDGSGTKDGNVWGRLLGFTRQMWTRSLGMDSQTTFTLKSMPEEAQMRCMTTFDPGNAHDGALAQRLKDFMNTCLEETGHQATAGPVGHYDVRDRSDYHSTGYGSDDYGSDGADELSKDPMVVSFLERCGLDMSAVDYLQRLPEDMLQQVINDFDHTGTKDGNVLGRLQGYVKLLCRKRGLFVDAEGAPAKRHRAQY